MKFSKPLLPVLTLWTGGYWVGMRIAEAYVARAADNRAAIRELIEFRDPAAILEASGYGR